MDTSTGNGPPWVPIPDYATGYPSPKRKLGKAWATAWAALAAAGEDWTDGVELAAEVVKPVGLQAVTMTSLMTRAASQGILERQLIKVPTGRGPRMRTHYRLPRT